MCFTLFTIVEKYVPPFPGSWYHSSIFFFNISLNFEFFVLGMHFLMFFLVPFTFFFSSVKTILTPVLPWSKWTCLSSSNLSYWSSIYEYIYEKYKYIYMCVYSFIIKFNLFTCMKVLQIVPMYTVCVYTLSQGSPAPGSWTGTGL